MALKERVGGNLGHLSNDQTSEFLAAAAPHGLKTLVLAHLSLKNNTPQLALAAAAQGLQQRGLSAVELVVAPARGPLRSAPQCK